MKHPKGSMLTTKQIELSMFITARTLQTDGHVRICMSQRGRDYISIYSWGEDRYSLRNMDPPTKFLYSWKDYPLVLL